jgi:hypothetical protein
LSLKCLQGDLQNVYLFGYTKQIVRTQWKQTHLVPQVDFSTPSASNGPEAPDVAQVVFLGLNIVIPLISLELLKYPKLCRQYFSLLAHMLEVYPEKVAVLPQAQFGSIITSLDFGLRHQVKWCPLARVHCVLRKTIQTCYRLTGSPGIIHRAILTTAPEKMAGDSYVLYS